MARWLQLSQGIWQTLGSLRGRLSASTLCKRLCFVYYFAKSKTVGFRKPEYLPILRHQAPESVPIASTWGILGHTARSRPREWNPISQNELKEIVNDSTSQAGSWVWNCCDFMPVKCRCFRNWWNELCDAGKGIRNSTFLCRDEQFQARLLLAAAGCALYTVRLASTCGVNVIVCWFWESTRHELAKHCPFSWFLPGLFTISMWLVGKSLLGNACCMCPCLGPFGKDLRSNFVIDEAWLNSWFTFLQGFLLDERSFISDIHCKQLWTKEGGGSSLLDSISRNFQALTGGQR